VEAETIWLKPPATLGGEPKEIRAADREQLVPLMVAGWVQISQAEAEKAMFHQQEEK
jgi:hypothetical protein